MPNHQNVHEAISAVMQEVGYVLKQRGANLNYTYAGEAALIAAIRPHMVANDLIVFPSGVSNRMTREYLTKSSTAMVNVSADFSFTFWHGPSDTGFCVTVPGEGSDAGDKAWAKAATIAYKYALRQTFMIETGDDPDKYPSSDYERDPDDVKARGNARQEPPAPRRGTKQAEAVSSEGDAAEWPTRPWNANTIKAWCAKVYDDMSDESKTKAMTADEHKKLGMAVSGLFPDKPTRKVFQHLMFGGENYSIEDMSVATGKTYRAWARDAMNAKVEVDNIIATQEFADMATAIANGQTEMG